MKCVGYDYEWQAFLRQTYPVFLKNAEAKQAKKRRKPQVEASDSEQTLLAVSVPRKRKRMSPASPPPQNHNYQASKPVSYDLDDLSDLTELSDTDEEEESVEQLLFGIRADGHGHGGGRCRATGPPAVRGQPS